MFCSVGSGWSDMLMVVRKQTRYILSVESTWTSYLCCFPVTLISRSGRPLLFNEGREAPMGLPYGLDIVYCAW